MAHSDDIFPNHPTGVSEHVTREQAEQQDRASLHREQFERERLGNEQVDIWSDRRVTPPGSGDGTGGRIRRNSDW